MVGVIFFIGAIVFIKFVNPFEIGVTAVHIDDSVAVRIERQFAHDLMRDDSAFPFAAQNLLQRAVANPHLLLPVSGRLCRGIFGEY